MIKQSAIAFFLPTSSLPVVRLFTMARPEERNLPIQVFPDPFSWDVERLAFNKLCVMINLQRQFKRRNVHPFCTQMLTVLTEAMRLWSLTLVVFLVTSPLLPLIVYSVRVVNGEACTPTDTFASLGYIMFGGLLAGAAPAQTLAWCYGFRKSFAVSFAIYALLKIGTDVIVLYLRLSVMRLPISTALIFAYWFGCCGYHFMQVQGTSAGRAVFYYGPFPLLVGTSVVTMHHVFRYAKSPVFLYTYRFLIHPVWYWLCIRLCGWLVLCGWSNATGKSPIMAVPFIFMLTKNMIGRYVQTQLPYREFAVSLAFLAVLEVVAYTTYPLRRKWLMRLMPKIQALSSSVPSLSKTTVVVAALEPSIEVPADNPLQPSAEKGTPERSTGTHHGSSKAATGSAESKSPSDAASPQLNTLAGQDSDPCAPESEPPQGPIGKDRRPRLWCRDLVYPSLAVTPVGTDDTADTFAWPANEDPGLAAQGSLIDNLHFATLLANIVLEPLVILQLSVCKFLFIWSNALPVAESYTSIATEAACILAVQAVVTVFLLWWTRYQHNLSVPEVTRYVGWRRCAVALVCLSSCLSMVCLRVMTIGSQQLDYGVPFCP